jgi:hypothetical protein
MYIRSKQQVFRTSNMISGFWATGLWPLSPISVLEKLPIQAIEQDDSVPLSSLDLLLLQTNPLDGTELCQANALLNTEINKAENLPLSIERYISRLTQAFEAVYSKNNTLWNEIS